MNDMSYPETSPAPVYPKKNRSLLLVILLAVLGVVIVVAAFLAIDPLGWNTVGNLKVLLGLGGDPVTASIPPEPVLYMGVDLLNATPDKLNRLIEPFAQVYSTDKLDYQTSIEDLDKQLKDSLGLTITDDVLPWIGKSAGVGVSDLKIDQSGLQDATVVISIQSRDNKKADEFLVKLKAGIEKNNDVALDEGAYEGVNIFSMKGASSSRYSPGLAFGRSGDVVIFSLSEKGMMAAIDTQKGDSLAKDKNYQALVNQLPKERFLTMYFSSQQLKDLVLPLFNDLSSGYGAMSTEQYQNLMTEQLDKTSGQAISYTIVDAGLQMDIATAFNVDKLSTLEKNNMKQIKVGVKSLDMLPADTLAFVASNVLNESWTTLHDQIVKGGGITQSEYDQSMSELEKQININPEKDLFPYMAGDVVLAVSPSYNGLIPNLAKINLGMTLVIESNDSVKMGQTVDTFSKVVEDQLLGAPLTVQTTKDLKYYSAEDPSSGTEAFAMGMGKQYLVVGTSGDLLEGLFAGKSSLTSNSRYQSAVKALPGGANPLFYLDVEGLLNKVRSGQTGSSLKSFDESVKFLKPIPTVIMGNSLLSDSMSKMTIVVLITPAK